MLWDCTCKFVQVWWVLRGRLCLTMIVTCLQYRDMWLLFLKNPFKSPLSMTDYWKAIRSASYSVAVRTFFNDEKYECFCNRKFTVTLKIWAKNVHFPGAVVILQHHSVSSVLFSGAVFWWLNTFSVCKWNQKYGWPVPVGFVDSFDVDTLCFGSTFWASCNPVQTLRIRAERLHLNCLPNKPTKWRWALVPELTKFSILTHWSRLQQTRNQWEHTLHCR